MADQEWRELCERASKEMDPDKLMDIIKRLNDVLERRERQLRGKLAPTDPATENTLGRTGHEPESTL